ncbi:MAG TPA: DUF4055 domain-containing protein, partial [Dongiaceae bacterium]|nr:DUF4055 domain-containing protein [Dongiaceae bacterium]
DGAGVSATQQAKRACALTLAYSRAGLYVDYPKTEGATSVADLESGNIRPTINLYHPLNIVNWRTKRVNAKTVLSLVVLQEQYMEDDDDINNFEPDIDIQYRVLRLEKDGRFSVTIYRDDEQYEEVMYPTGPDGQPLDEIPFTFIGIEANDCKIEDPAMFALCDLNMAHYRNSADHEEMLFICGQATPVAAGLTAEWAEKFGEIRLGSRDGVLLPTGGTFELIQAEATGALAAEMLHKEEQMKSLGAKLVEQYRTQARTATEASQDEAAEMSVLSSVAKNVGAAYKFAFEWAAYLVGLGDRTAMTGDNEIEFDLNAEFDLNLMTSLDRAQLMKEWQAGAITDREYRDALQSAGIAEEEFDAWEADKAAKAEADIANAAAMIGATTAAAQPTDQQQQPVKNNNNANPTG